MGRLRDMRDVVIDKWSPIAHKAPLKEDGTARLTSGISGWSPSSWTGEEHRRRLTSYMILAAYDQNVSRHFLDTDDDSDRDERREYGDAGLVIDQVLAHLLGDSQEVVVPGAEDYDPELVAPEPTDDDPNPDGPTPEELAANGEARGLSELQDFLRTWADDVHLPLRMTDAERNAVGLGDAVYLLGWDERRERPTCAVMDPGFYFPVLPDTLDAYDYPETVHFAWELPPEDYSDRKTRVRRITYRLGYLAPEFDEVAYELATTEEEREAAFSLPEGAEWRTIDGFREVVRQYPWDAPGEPSRRTCTVTDATWILDDLDDASKPDAFDLDKAIVRVEYVEGQAPREVRDLDLGIDFLPVVHVPNTPPGGDHYGQSSLARVLQLLDDIQNADTDAQAASATTGSPIIGLSGAATGGDDPLTGRRGQSLEVRPGVVWRLGENGGMDVLDTSGALQATRDYVKHLLERLAVNSRLPAAVLGMVKPSEVPSGYAMQLSFGPLTSMIRQMRLVRSVKYPLLLKMVVRLYQANGALPAGPTPRIELQLGAYLPSDMAGTLTAVREAYAAKIISLETAVAKLLEVGFPIDDVAEEVARIQSRDFEGASALADATGDVDEARKYLGLESNPDDRPTAVPPVIPTPGSDA